MYQSLVPEFNVGVCAHYSSRLKHPMAKSRHSRVVNLHNTKNLGILVVPFLRQDMAGKTSEERLLEVENMTAVWKTTSERMSKNLKLQ